jgi:hypothetical protein
LHVGHHVWLYHRILLVKWFQQLILFSHVIEWDRKEWIEIVVRQVKDNDFAKSSVRMVSSMKTFDKSKVYCHHATYHLTHLGCQRWKYRRTAANCYQQLNFKQRRVAVALLILKLNYQTIGLIVQGRSS